MSPAMANISGVFAILLWSSTALLFTYCSSIPPFTLASETALVAFLIFVIVWKIKGESVSGQFKAGKKGIIYCTLGIGAYRAIMLAALGLAPVVEASLINYLWPLLIVLFTQFLPDHTIKKHHVIGALLGFSGLFVLLHKDGEMFGDITIGHILALIAAVLWAAYSVGTRVMKAYSSNAVPVSFLFSGFAMAVIGFFVEGYVAVDWHEYVFMVLMAAASGIGYFLWDQAMKHGHIQIMGVASYFTPLLSTLLLIAFGKAEAAPNIMLATLLIVSGPLIASRSKVRDAIRELKNRRKKA